MQLLQHTYIYRLILLLIISFGFTFSHAQISKTSNTQTNTSNSSSNEEIRKIAIELFNNREFEKACELFKQLYEKDPSLSNYSYLLKCYIQSKDKKEIEKLVKGQIKNNKGGSISRFYCDLGYFYNLIDERDKAETEFKNAIEALKPNDNDIYNLANLFLSYGLYSKSADVYIAGRKIMNDPERFMQELAYIYELLGDNEKMIEYYLDYVKEDPKRVNNIKYRLQYVINKDFGNASETLKIQLLKRIQKEPGNIAYAELILWLAIEQQDFELAINQAIALDKILNENGERLYKLAQTAYSVGNNKYAAKAAEYIISKGDQNAFYLSSKEIELKIKSEDLNIKDKHYKTKLENLLSAYKIIIEKYGYTPETAILISDYSKILGFTLNECKAATEVLEKLINIPNLRTDIRADFKLQLADIYLLIDDPWEASLLYSQVEKTFKNDPVGHDAKFRNAMLTYYEKEFDWAKAQADILKAATSKLTANDAMYLSLLISDNKDADSSFNGLSYFAHADLLIYKKQYAQAEKTLDSIFILFPFHPLNDDVIFKKYEIAIATGNYPKADTLLNNLYVNYPESIYKDKAMFLRAVLNEVNLHNNELAKELYMKIITEHPGSFYLSEARNRYRNLNKN